MSETPSSRGALAQHLRHRVAPVHAAFGHLIQRRRALGSQLAEDVPGLPAGLAAHLGIPPDHPLRHAIVEIVQIRSKLVPDRRVESLAGSSGSRARSVEHILGSRAQRLAETTDILPWLLYRSGLRSQRSRRVLS